MSANRPPKYSCGVDSRLQRSLIPNYSLSLLVLFSLSCAILLSPQFTVDAAQIVDYTVTSYTKREVDGGTAPSWAAYNESFADRDISQASYTDDSVSHSDIHFKAPFFSSDSLSLFINSNGFVSPTPTAMCNGFCTDTSVNTMYGSYTSSKSFPKGGANWPMAALYVVDLNPSVSVPRNSVRSTTYTTTTLDSSSSATEVAIVDFVNVSILWDYGGRLTAQIEMWGNGTFIFRYHTLPDDTYIGQTRYPPTVGLILSDRRRVLTTAPTQKNQIVAIRFSPVLDTCESTFLTESTCVAAITGSATGGACLWCSATDVCVDSNVASSTCPRVSTVPRPISSTAEATGLSEQDFYSVSISQGSRVVPLDSKDFTGLNETMPILTTLSLDFDFPFFTASDPERIVNTSYLRSEGFVSVFRSSQPCNPLWRVCPNGNYSFSIVPFLSSTFGLGSFKYARMPARDSSSPFCDAPSGSSCPKAMVITFSTDTMAPTKTATFQLYFDADGVIEMRFASAFVWSSNYVFARYPYPQIGIYRYGADDPSSILIPWEMIRGGTRIVFTPVKNGCNDCGVGGRCTAGATPTCTCNTGFTGDDCDACESQYYGPQCQPCAPCGTNGICQEGMNGTGQCVCNEPYSGAHCDVLCPDGVSPQCDDCDLSHGYCECGVCKCHEGYGGDSCRWDVCMQASFDGCEACVSTPSASCGLCFDYTCVSTNVATPLQPAAHACSYMATNITSPSICYAPIVQSSALDYGYIILGVLLFILVVSVILLGSSIILVRRVRSIFDYHASAAAGGIPGIRNRKREREVVLVSFIPPSFVPKGLRVMAMPLKQISLEKLYNIQHGNKDKTE